MLIISFDAVGNDEFENLMQYPTFASFCNCASVYRGVSSVFPTNTYPVHASIATGVVPGVHGITSNTEPFPTENPIWNSKESGIRVKTIWQAAAEKGIQTASVFWPVTAYSKSIRYNIPEVLARPNENQLITSMKAGSKFLQLKMFLKYGNKLKLSNGINQPNLDSFATACMVDILRKNKPGLALIHLTAYDTLCHRNGKGSSALDTAYESLDRNLALLLEAAGDDRDVILFSDHSQLNVHTVLYPNEMLVTTELLQKIDNGYLLTESGCFIESCGGSAFFHSGRLPPVQIEELRERVMQSEGFGRFLTKEELNEAGYDTIAFGFCAREGFCYAPVSSPKHREKANHGYTVDIPGYDVFYAVKGCDSGVIWHNNGSSYGSLQPCGAIPQNNGSHLKNRRSLLDITAIVARYLDLEMEHLTKSTDEYLKNKEEIT